MTDNDFKSEFITVPVLLVAVLVISIAAATPAEDPSPKSSLSADEVRAASQEALEEFNSLIGGWRGVGQPVRGSNKGAWSETADWVWEIKKESIGIRYGVKEGKLLTSGLLTFDPDRKSFVLKAVLPDKSERVYSGTLSGKKLTLQTEPDNSGTIHQLVVTLLNEKRTLTLFQSRQKNQPQFSRIAEIGYTREGTKLAEEGPGGPECIVSGGKGTMSTVYMGKTYWFCCTGCRDAFLDDPDAMIAEAEKRTARKKEK